jgi:hypothetical protein
MNGNTRVVEEAQLVQTPSAWGFESPATHNAINQAEIMKTTTISSEQDLIAKLNNLTWVSTDGDAFKSREGFTISWSHKLHSDGFQLLIRITKGEAYIMTWGCSGDKNQRELEKWLHATKSRIINERHNALDAEEKQAKGEFERI